MTLNRVTAYPQAVARTRIQVYHTPRGICQPVAHNEFENLDFRTGMNGIIAARAIRHGLVCLATPFGRAGIAAAGQGGAGDHGRAGYVGHA